MQCSVPRACCYCCYHHLSIALSAAPVRLGIASLSPPFLLLCLPTTILLLLLPHLLDPGTAALSLLCFPPTRPPTHHPPPSPPPPACAPTKSRDRIPPPSHPASAQHASTRRNRPSILTLLHSALLLGLSCTTNRRSGHNLNSPTATAFPPNSHPPPDYSVSRAPATCRCFALLYCSALPCRQPAPTPSSRTQALPCRTAHYCFCCCPPARTPYSPFRVESPCLCLLSYPFLPLGAHCHLPAADTTHHSSTSTLHGLEPHQQTSSSSVPTRTQGRIPLHVIQRQEFYTQHHPRNTSRFDGGRTSETATLPVSLTSNWLPYSFLCVSELISNVARLLRATPANTPSGTLWLRESLRLNSHQHPPAHPAAPPSIHPLP